MVSSIIIDDMNACNKKISGKMSLSSNLVNMNSFFQMNKVFYYVNIEEESVLKTNFQVIY